jgi:hypothetical protein
VTTSVIEVGDQKFWIIESRRWPISCFGLNPRPIYMSTNLSYSNDMLTAELAGFLDRFKFWLPKAKFSRQNWALNHIDSVMSGVPVVSVVEYTSQSLKSKIIKLVLAMANFLLRPQSSSHLHVHQSLIFKWYANGRVSGISGYVLAGSFHIYKEVSCTLLSCIQALFTKKLAIASIQLSRISVRQPQLRWWSRWPPDLNFGCQKQNLVDQIEPW